MTNRLKGKPPLSKKPESFPFTSGKMVDASFFLAGAVEESRKDRARFVLFGDFDVDGTSSAAILSLYLSLYGVSAVSVFVSRRKDGYGLSDKSLARLSESITGVPFAGTTHVILMDLGVNTTSEAECLLKLGGQGGLGPVAVSVIDHHVPAPHARDEWNRLASQYPGLVSAYDPLLYDDPEDRYFRCLSAAGLVQRINEVILDADIYSLGTVAKNKVPVSILSNQGVKKMISRKMILNSIEKIAAIAQASDVMPYAISGELTVAWEMSKKFEDTAGSLLPGVAELYKKTNTASRIGWVIGPILNAAGRLEDAYASYDLMTEISDDDARQKMLAVEETRTRVQAITGEAWTVMDEMVKTDLGVCVVVLDRDRVGPGIVGIAASKACEKYGRPSVCLVEAVGDDGVPVLKGSMRRGSTDFSCEAWILSLRQKGIAVAGGGHPAAAGMTILASRYEEFIAHAIDQTFTSTRPPVYEVTVAQAREHLREVETVMPFGNGNTASRLQIDGLITSIRPLVRKDDGVVWCYIIHLSERDDPADFIEVKVMARDLSTEAHNMFLAISGKQIHLPSIIEFEAFDGFRAGFSTRGEFRVATTIRSEESVRKSLGSWLDLNRTSESGSFAHVSIKQDEIKTKLEEADAARGKTQVAAARGKTIEKKPEDPRPTSDRQEGPGTDNRGGSAGSLSDVLTGDAPEKLDIAEDEIISGSTKDDIAMISNFVLRTASDARPYKVTCVVDHDDSLPAGTFLLKRPAKNEVISLIGEDGIDIVTAAHGGRWSPELKGYIIAAGAVSTLKPCPSGLYHFIFTKRAILAAAAVDEHNKTIIAVKSDAEPFRVPFLRPAKTPFGFQYADVRCFLTRDVSLCYNDMGTGKTFEAAMWGATHIAASSLNLNLRSVVLDKAISSLAPLVDDKIKPDGDMADLFSGGSTRPILVATMASIANQFAGEIESFLTLKAKVLSTEDINLLIEAAGVRMPKKGQTMPQLKEAPEKLIKAFRKDVIGGHGFIVATYDCLSRHPWVVSAFDWSGVICDEAHELKGSNTHKTKAVFGDKIDRAPLLRDGRYIPILAMSGTFPKNRPGDWFVWTRLTEADGGVYTAGSLSDAQRRFDRRFDGLTYKEIWLRRGGGPARKVIVPDKGTPEHGDELKAILAPYLVRRLKDEINDLPPMRLQVRRTPSDGLYLDILMNIRTGKPLSESSKDLLRRHDLLAANDTFKGEDPEDLDGKPSIAAASLAGKLAMVSALDKASGITSTLDSLGWIGGPTKDEPFVVIVFHRSALREVSRQLEMRGITHFTMSQDDAIEEREAKKTAFQSGERQAFVTTYGVGGTGLNLTRAARLLCAHLPWTDTALAQARDRIFRIGQTRPTSVVVLLLAASIDESTYYLIKHKGRANFKTASVDKMRTKGTSLPAWATGSVLDYDVRRSGDQEASKDETEKDPDDKPKSGWLS